MYTRSSPNRAKPTLFYMIGFPGSGKTSFASSLSASSDLLYLSADKIGIETFQELKFNDEQRRYVLEEMDWQAENYLRDNTSIIYDANNNLLSERERLRALAKKINADIVSVRIKTPVYVAKQRLRSIGKIGYQKFFNVTLAEKSEAYFQQFFENFEEPGPSEQVINISGTTSPNKQLEVFQEQTGFYPVPHLTVPASGYGLLNYRLTQNSLGSR